MDTTEDDDMNTALRLVEEPAPVDAELAALLERVDRVTADATPHNTKLAIKGDWERFESWTASHGVASLPAEPEVVSAYLLALGDGGKARATIQRAAASINAKHLEAGLVGVTAAPVVKATLKLLGRQLATRAIDKAPPMFSAQIHAGLTALKATTARLTWLRDRALLLCGFGWALRREEVAAVHVEALNWRPEGVTVKLGITKGDQDGARALDEHPLFALGGEWCPVRALREWLDAAQIASGPVFRSIDRHGNIGQGALTPASVARVVAACAVAAGLGDGYSGHSLRAGCATELIENGASREDVQRHLRHAKRETTEGYYRRLNVFKSTVAGRAGKGEMQ